MTRRTVFLFSGQGSQYYQMGRGLYESNPTFRYWMERLDAQAAQELGVSVLGELYGSRSRAELFEDLRLTHPAIFMVEYALARAVIALGVTPGLTLGASLGTLVALAVSGRLQVETALQLVLGQSRVIVERCPAGGMVAVMAAPRLYWTTPALRELTVVAGQNFAAHFVLAMPAPHLREVEAVLRAADATFQRLPVPYPFHSPWMDPIRERLLQACPERLLGPGEIPLVCCALGGVLAAPPVDYFWRVARDPIDFMHTIERLELDGPFDYVDLGPAGTFSTFLKYQLGKSPASRFTSVMSPFGGETTESVSAALARLRRA